MKQVGLEAIAFDIPEHYINLHDLALARGIDPAKFTKGLGQLEMAVATAAEDPVVLAIGAASRALRNFSIDPRSIGLLIVGTESSVDQSKALSSFLHEHLGLSSECRNFEVKHACYGAMAGVSMATDWILSGRARGKKALVVSADIARYGLLTPGEPTQGAGSVAMVISESPSLLSFHTERQGFYSKQVMDFWRPNYSKDAFADGHFSMECYLEALSSSYAMYAKTEMGMAKSFGAALYHAPFVKMAQKAHVRLWELSHGATCEAGSANLVQAKDDYERRVAPYLELNARVGNIYTGALFLSLLCYLEKAEKSAMPISLFSYGSGCVAEFSSMSLLKPLREFPGYEASVSLLAKRKKISIPEYEAIMGDCAKMDSNNFKPQQSFPLSRKLLYRGCVDHQRIYS